jgi:hypothetical protein
VLASTVHVHGFQATKCIVDRIRIRRTHLLTVEKVEEIDAKLETPARKALDRQAQVTELLVYIISTNLQQNCCLLVLTRQPCFIKCVTHIQRQN